MTYEIHVVKPWSGMEIATATIKRPGQDAAAVVDVRLLQVELLEPAYVNVGPPSAIVDLRPTRRWVVSVGNDDDWSWDACLDTEAAAQTLFMLLIGHETLNEDILAREFAPYKEPRP